MATEPTRTEPEVRTPGSDFVLPANPLSDLTDDQLQGFIDCTLYEETGNFFEGGTVDLAEVAARRGSSRTNPPSFEADAPDPAQPFRSTTGMPFGGEVIRAHRVSSPPSIGMDAASEPDHTFPPYGYTPPGMQFPVEVRSQVTPLPGTIPPPIYPASSVQGLPPGYPVGSGFGAPAASAPEVLAAPRMRWWLVAGSLVLALAVVVVVMQLSASSARESPATGSAAERTGVKPPPFGQSLLHPAEDRVSAAVDAPVHAAVVPAPDEPVAGGLPVVGKGQCRMSVTVTPAGSEVKLDGDVMGPSPLEIDTPCEKRRVDIAHPRYAPVTRWVTPTPAKTEAVEVTLVRPTHSVTVVTVPAGATVSIEGRRAGVTPTVVQLMGFAGVTLTFEKKGYKTATQRVYSRQPQERITVRLLESFKL